MGRWLTTVAPEESGSPNTRADTGSRQALGLRVTDGPPRYRVDCWTNALAARPTGLFIGLIPSDPRNFCV